jgi:hypothetical protein
MFKKFDTSVGSKSKLVLLFANLIFHVKIVEGIKENYDTIKHTNLIIILEQ